MTQVYKYLYKRFSKSFFYQRSVQSPGRDSPGSSSGSAGSGSRHSTASLDSGRASYHPLSTAGRSTIGSSNSPRCSLSSCSIGSDQSRIEAMINQGLPVSVLLTCMGLLNYVIV